MFYRWLVLAALASYAVWGQAPTYAPDSILNGADFTPAPFAPGSIVSIFGANLSFGTEAYTANNSQGNLLPDYLADVRVYVNNLTSPLIYVSPAQINFVVPDNLLSGTVPVRVVRQGVTGPEAQIALVDAAPRLFSSGGFVIAQHGVDYSLVTADAPARPGEVVVVYATGLGRTAPEPEVFEIPQYPGLLVNPLELFLDGAAVAPGSVFYAGLTPGSAGVYQINLTLPATMGSNPEIRVTVAGQESTAGLQLAATGS